MAFVLAAFTAVSPASGTVRTTTGGRLRTEGVRGSSTAGRGASALGGSVSLAAGPGSAPGIPWANRPTPAPISVRVNKAVAVILSLVRYMACNTFSDSATTVAGTVLAAAGWAAATTRATLRVKAAKGGAMPA